MNEPVTNIAINLLGRMAFSFMIQINKALTKKFFPFRQDRLRLSFPGHLSGTIDEQCNKYDIEAFLHLDNNSYYDVLITGAVIELCVGVDRVLHRDKLLHIPCRHDESVEKRLTFDLGRLETDRLFSTFGQAGEKPASLYIDLFLEIKTGKEVFHYKILDQRLRILIRPLPNSVIEKANRLLET
ncbi:MAG: hypothetical protein ABSF80_07320 [Chitinispirillaceae bacterium]|jgi:hypothetical protein